MMPLKAAFWTLGCKLNQTETEAIAAAFHKEGYSVSCNDDCRDTEAGGAGIVIINSCTVTSKSEQKARRLIRLLLRAPRAPFIMVTGCYAQLDRERLWALDERPAGERRLFVLGVDDKNRLLHLPAALKTAKTAPDIEALLSRKPPESGSRFDARFSFLPERWLFHSRALLKIQDGCDHACTYCRIRLARGPALSLDARLALDRLRTLEDSGIEEAVLTGVNIGRYRSEGMDLGDLINYLLDGTNRIALRLSSLEQAAFTPSLFAAFSRERLMPHAHLSVQSGSEAVLLRMGRPARLRELLQSIETLRRIKDDPFIACDIIAGFPGETESDFKETLRICAEADFAWIHAFPFSPRPGTAAALMAGKVAEQKISQRVETLAKLAEEGKKRYIQRWLGKKTFAIVEQSGSPRYTVATSANYLKIALPQEDAKAGARVLCRVETVCTESGIADVLGVLC